MPGLNKAALFDRFEAALTASGWNFLRLGSAAVHPRNYSIFRSAESYQAIVYLWTLTPGGKHRPKDEWRIQPTGISKFLAAPRAKTAVLGYEPERDLFVGFDYQFHKGPLGKSSSLQTKESALDVATATGFGPYTKGTAEVPIAIRPDMLGMYLADLEALHAAGATPAERALLDAISASPESVDPADIDSIAPPERRRALRTSLRTIRDSRFRRRVLDAYSHRCAMCGVQLNLLDAAHILPVGYPGSTDAVTNGVALCALHHRSYDDRLVAFDAAYAIKISKDREAKLAAVGQLDGLAHFKSALKSSLALPTSGSSHPDKTMIKKANEVRGWKI